MFAQEISASRFVELCLGVVVEILILPHTQTHTILPQNFTNNFFFTPLAVHTRYFSCEAVTFRDWRTFFSAVTIYRPAPSFPLYRLRGGI